MNEHPMNGERKTLFLLRAQVDGKTLYLSKGESGMELTPIAGHAVLFSSRLKAQVIFKKMAKNLRCGGKAFRHPLIIVKKEFVIMDREPTPPAPVIANAIE